MIGPAIRRQCGRGALVLGAWLCAWSPALAEPLRFGAFDGRADLSATADLTRCEDGADGGRTCRLSRTGFGGLPIERGQAVLNSAGRVRTIEIALDDRDFRTAHQLLVGRYGQPSSSGQSVHWRGFDDEASIALERGESRTLVSLRFPANDEAPATLDRSLALPALLFLVLGLAVGLLLRRMRPVRPAPPIMREPTMRETLERRLARGDDLGL